jgi:uncharacterized protein YndB with AHSA1/START domain
MSDAMKTWVTLAAFALLAGCGVSAAAQERAVQKEAVVKAPIDAVWRAWTTSEGIVTFFAPEAVVEPRPGGAFFVHFNPYAPAGMKGADDMRVLAVQEKKLLSFTWNAPPHLPEARAQRTFVTVRFSPAGDGETLVRLRHSGWGDGGQWDEAYAYFDGAWTRVLEELQKRFTVGPRDWKGFLERMKAFQAEEDRKRGAGK